MTAACWALALAAGWVTAAAPVPVDVRVGAYVHDIHNVDLQTHSFAADVYLWFQWEGARTDPSASMEFMNAYELWGHTRTVEWERPLEVAPGRFHQVVRVQGRFSSKFNLARYPLDAHVLAVEFEDAHQGLDGVQYVPDLAGVRVNPALRLPGFSVGAPQLTVEAFNHPTGFGLPDDTALAHTFSRGRLTLPLSRPSAAYAVKLLAPLLCVVMCALLMFLFRARHVDARVGLGSTALLTVVALQITLNDDLPAVEYLVLMDELYLVAFAVVLGGLGLVVATTRMMERGEEARAERWDRRGLFVLAVLGALAMVAAVVWA